MAVLKLNYYSLQLKMPTNVTVILPTPTPGDTYFNREVPFVPGQKYQTLYLLHGGSGDDCDYIHNTNIVRYAEENKIAVVMPCDYNACYTDYDYERGPRYYSFIADELPTVMASMLPLSQKREDTFIGGLSMGSHGAMKVAINHPERFAAVLLMSGAATRPGVRTVVPTKDGVFDFESPLPPIPLGDITKMIEDPEFIRGTVNDVYAVAKKNAEDGVELPEFFFRVGDCDHALHRAQLAEKDLRAWGYKTRIEVVKGLAHEWDLWDETLKIALREWLPLKRKILYPDD